FPALRLAIPRRAELLANDLEAMGASRQAIAAVPTCEHLPPLASPAQIAGCVYVLEGASLGGLVIARAVERSVGVSRHRGASFFAGPGTGHAVGARWKSTLDWLEEVVRSG